MDRRQAALRTDDPDDVHDDPQHQGWAGWKGVLGGDRVEPDPKVRTRPSPTAPVTET